MAALIPRWQEELKAKRDESLILERKVARTAAIFAGLKDVEDILTLAVLKFEITLLILENICRLDGEAREDYFLAAGEEVRSGKNYLESLTGNNLDAGDAEKLKMLPLYGRARDLFREILISGGAGFFEAEDLRRHQKKALSRAVAAAVRKYASPDDSPHVLFRTEDMPPGLRSFLNLVFPSLAAEDLAPPPYGIPEGEEVEVEGEYLVMPLSQGIVYLEEELLPETEHALAVTPGDPDLQEKRRWIEERLDQWRRMKFIPRANPVLLNQDFYTHGLSQYTPDGEPLVRFKMPVRFKSGTNLDRQGELIRWEVVRRLAGRGLFPELDRDYLYRKSLESGRRGSSRIPSLKVDAGKGFRALKTLAPSLAMLEDKESLARLIEQSGTLSPRRFLRNIEKSLGQSGSVLPRDLLE